MKGLLIKKKNKIPKIPPLLKYPEGITLILFTAVIGSTEASLRSNIKSLVLKGSEYFGSIFQM